MVGHKEAKEQSDTKALYILAP